MLRIATVLLVLAACVLGSLPATAQPPVSYSVGPAHVGNVTYSVGPVAPVCEGGTCRLPVARPVATAPPVLSFPTATYAPPVTYATPAANYPALTYTGAFSQSCPGGVCPAPQRRGLFGFRR